MSKKSKCKSRSKNSIPAEKDDYLGAGNEWIKYESIQNGAQHDDDSRRLVVIYNYLFGGVLYQMSEIIGGEDDEPFENVFYKDGNRLSADSVTYDLRNDPVYIEQVQHDIARGAGVTTLFGFFSYHGMETRIESGGA